MRLAPKPRAKSEPTIALINIVFLMLVFFLVAGQIARPVDRDVTLVDASLPNAKVPDDALVLRADGTLLWRGEAVTLLDFAVAQVTEPEGPPLRILPDRDAPARALIAVSVDLRAITGRDIRLVTQQSAAP